ncbi:Brain-specific angiogenesis inhibitor 1-associated protein 2 [Frankliniella fusca]|uniref:Brain-specific angiogenesis inhibitor 1-associated protein 2 n=1 Tax=Frankliniella fusca TaxID=407009 RepID=A0AAE1HVZ5_9NEOP|nr:Brain-specific angiogenesis inhibitor 1-associated protein 2 [Frankliniella fusca]
MNILKAFYVDLLVPLETNLEKDTKVVQMEQKKFNAQHKQRSESHSKAAAMSRKQRKKNKTTTNEKDLKTLQRLEEEQSKLDAFREQSLRTALTQERRRYGFVLERQCSLAKHFLSLHSRGEALFQQRLPDWQRVARARESLPEEVQRMFSSRPQSMWADDDSYCRREDGSMASALRKTRSMDASALDIRCLSDAPEDQHRGGDGGALGTLSRARSDLNLSSRAHSPNGDSASPVRPQSLAVSSAGRGWGSPLARALYAYLSSGENQLSFLEGDILALMGERNKGWQFGENLRTQTSGWFPLAYTELLLDDV